jgi:hypothetical protein
MKKLLADWSDLIRGHRRGFQLLVLLLLLGFAADFTLRVLVLRDSDPRSFSAPEAATLAAADTAESIGQRLSAWIPTKEAEPVAQERQISLQGVFGAGSEARAALLLGAPGGPPERVRATVGQVVEGWTVERIELGRVLLKRGEESRELVLFRPKPE